MQNSLLIHTFSLLAADMLGRIDRGTLNAQQKMELLVAEIYPKDLKRFQDKNGMFRELKQWPGVRINKSGAVKTIKLGSLGPGSIALDFIPNDVEEFFILASPNLEGPLNAMSLPRDLKKLSVMNTSLSGTLDLGNLPRAAFVCLNIVKSKFTGSLDLTDLPPKSIDITLKSCAFTGTVDLSSLPASLRSLDISNHCLEGEVDLCHLPPRFENLIIRENNFSRTVDLTALPVALRRLDISNNCLEGEVNLCHLPPRFEDLIMRENNFSGEFRILDAPRSLKRVFASGNAFKGNAVVPRELFLKVFLSNNQIVKIRGS